MKIVFHVLSLLAASMPHAFGAVVDGPYTFNGHTYYLLDAKSWTASQAEAVSMGGNLVTVNSEAEWIFLVDKFFTTQTVAGPEVKLWLGLQDQNNDEVYAWISGDPVTFTLLSAPDPSTSEPFITVDNPAGFQGRDPDNPDPSWDPELVATSLTWSDRTDSSNFHGIVEIAPSGISLSIGGNMIASGGAHGFGEVDLGQNATVTVTLSNPGTGTLHNIAASIPSGGADFSLLTTPPATLATGASANFQLRFAPQTTGVKTGTLRLTSNATPSPYDIQLSGSGVDTGSPVIGVEAADLEVNCDDPAKTDLVNAWLQANGGASATDNSGSVIWTNNFTAMPAVCDPATILFTASDPEGNASTTSAQLTIVDETPPMVGIPAGSITVETDGLGNTAALNAWLADNGSASASDTCGEVTWSNDFTSLDGTLPQTVVVVFSASDTCGNTSTTSASFTIEDTVPPAITQAAQDFYGDCEGDPAAQMATFLANHGGASATDIGSAVTWTNNYSGTLPTCRNFVTVTFTASDSSGNTATTSSRFFLFPPGTVWVGTEQGDWVTPGLWHNGVPTTDTDAYVDLFDFQNSTVTVGGFRSVKNLFVSQGDTVRIANSASLSVAGSEIDNEGLIEMGYGSTSAALKVAGEVTLHGSGAVKLTGGGANLIGWQSSSVNDILKLDPAHEITTDADTIAGNGNSAIAVRLINQGTVTADQGGLALTSTLKTNEGLFRAIRGGTLRLNNTALENSAGSIFIDGDSRFELVSGTLTGGELSGDGFMEVSGLSSALGGGLEIGPAVTSSLPVGDLRFASDLVNDGLIQLGGAGTSRLRTDGSVTLSGSGKIRLQGGGANWIGWHSSSVNDILTLGPDHEITTDADTIAGNGNSAIAVRLINQGTITADQGEFALTSTLKTNEGLFRAIRGGTLRLNNTALENSAGSIFIDGDSRFELVSGTLTGGELSGDGLMEVSGLSSALGGGLEIGPAITSSLPVGDLRFASDLVNDGLIQLGGAGTARLRTDGSVTLSGSGKIRLQGGGANWIGWQSSSVNDILTLGPDHEITTDADTVATSTNSSIGVRLINQGTVSADQGELYLFSTPKTNEGLLRAIQGGTLVIANGVLTNYSGGVLSGGRWEVIAEGSPTLMDLQGASIHTLATNTFVRLSGGGASLPQLAALSHVHGTLSLESGKSFSTAGNLNITGLLEFGLGDGSIHGFDAEKLVVNGDVDFTGARIDIRDRGLIAGTYGLVQWTGSAIGVPVLENIPPGYNHSLVLDPATKTLKLTLSYSEFRIQSLQHNPDTRTTTIHYQSVDGLVHSVKGTENLVDFDDLPDTEPGTGGLLQYIHQAPLGVDKYFYTFSTNAP